MKGIKRFKNESNYQVSIELVVRKGDDVYHSPHNVLNFTLKPFEEKQIQYGNDDNPFLNELVATLVTDGNFVQLRERVILKSSSLDDDFNRHDTVLFQVEKDKLTTSFRNS